MVLTKNEDRRGRAQFKRSEGLRGGLKKDRIDKWKKAGLLQPRNLFDRKSGNECLGRLLGKERGSTVLQVMPGGVNGR